MSKLDWYWHRFRAMEPAEVALHARKKVRQFFDARGGPDGSRFRLETTHAFPLLPDPQCAPPGLREGLRRDAADILAGRWKAFGHLELRVDDPPQWDRDYLIGKSLTTDAVAFGLNHRALPEGADIKMIWELSRWHQLVRLAMAAYALGDAKAAGKCVDWLEDWVKHNPPYRGWNWTSALEVGIRLIQFTWIDALLLCGPKPATTAIAENYSTRWRLALQPRLEKLRHEILPAHACYAWRHKSFGSSANNHLIGELAGLIVATARWPHLIDWWVSLEELQRLWEREVLAQFAEDGGNKEQALNYHLFSWEFCWQARMALTATGKTIASVVERRIASAASFFWEVQVRREPWDYGDSDNALVTPFVAQVRTALVEWRDWMSQSLTNSGAALDYWLGKPPDASRPLLGREPVHATPVKGWWVFQRSGQAICELGHWWLRWDLSPLGYLQTAAHGHIDALHLSLWFKGVAVVIDPGTGAYFVDPELRTWLASRAAHNAPCPIGMDFPRRTGPFLWSEHHVPPDLEVARSVEREEFGPSGKSRLPAGTVRRSIFRTTTGDGWSVEDEFRDVTGSPQQFTVYWQFAPGSRIKHQSERSFSILRGEAAVEIQVDENWERVELLERNGGVDAAELARCESLEGIVSPAFRKVRLAPFLKLTARPEAGKPCVFRTTFLASPPA